MATAIEVVRKSAISWVLIPDGVAANDVQEAWWRGTRIGDLITFKSTNGAVEFKDINYQFISYLDEVTPGNSVPVFTSGYECYNYLKEQSFFDVGSEGGGSGTTLIGNFSDYPASYLGAALQLLRVNSSATAVEFFSKVIASKLSELTDGPGAYMDGKYVRGTATGWVWSDGFNVEQNNIGFRKSLGGYIGIPTTTTVVDRLNISTTVISEIQTPIIVSFYNIPQSEEENSKLYAWIFLPGKGTYGSGGTAVTASMLFQLPLLNLTPEDIENDPNVSIVNLDPVVDGDFVSKANEVFWDFSDSDYENGGMSYYFSYTDDGVLYYALFIGTPGTYGDGATPFVSGDFVTTTDSEVDPDPSANYVLIDPSPATNQIIQGNVVVEGQITGSSGVQGDYISSDTQVVIESLLPTEASHAIRKDVFEDALSDKADLVSGKVPLSQIPDSLIGAVNYQGTYNAATNTPTLPSAVGNEGHYYVISAAGTVGGVDFAIGDWIISNGVTWQKVDQTYPVDATVIDGSPNAVSGNAVFDALALKANIIGTLIVSTVDIPALSNLNTFTTTGAYFCQTNAIAAGGTNFPFAAAGKLEVIAHSSVNTYYQTYHTFQGVNTIYYRACFGGTWSTWKLVGEVQNSMTASTTLAPSVTAANTAINAKVEDNLTASTTVAPSKTAVNTALSGKAPLASPALTGTPTAPTAAAGTNTTQVATTAFVQAAARPYKVYTALIQQTGTNAPVATILENTLGTTITWSRNSVGNYTGTAGAAVFTNNKTTVNNIRSQSSTEDILLQRVSTTAVDIYTTLAGSSADGRLDPATNIGTNFVEIRVYN